MKLSKDVLVRGVYAILALVSIADIAMFAYVTVIRHSSEMSAWLFRHSIDTKGNFPPSGYSAAGNVVSLSSRSDAGWVVRYATPRCEHCRADEARWSSLKSQLINRGYRIYEIPPTATESYYADAPELAGETQISFVDVGWMKRLRFMSTPTTLLFNAKGDVTWTHVGEMSQEDQQSALQAVWLRR